MSKPKILVLRAPGINCERETFHAFEQVGAAPEYVHVRKLVGQPDLLDGFQVLMVPGGFAYGDDIAAGRVLANELRNHMGDRVLAFIERGGLALGICNGFQALVKLGLLPRLGDLNSGEGVGLEQQVTLTHNLSNHYECRWVKLQSPPNRCVFLPEGLSMEAPAAHAEGYLICKDYAQQTRLREEGYVAFHYIDADGSVTEQYPQNPNGSPAGIAGLTDVTGRVLGLMPHPDRAYLAHHMPDWRRAGLAEQGDGMELFAAMVRVAKGDG